MPITFFNCFKLARFIGKRLRKAQELVLIWYASVLHNRRIGKVAAKSKITVVFLVIHSSVWKYDVLYKLLRADPHYKPIIVICPLVGFGNDIVMAELNLACELFTAKGYEVVCTLNRKKNTWLDIKKILHPDIVFFTNPHSLTRKEYLITNFQNNLTCYCQYSFHVTHLNKMQYDQLFHNLLWKAFYETNFHLGLAKEYSRVKGRNVIVTGFPGVDIYSDEEYLPSDPWKKVKRNPKRIIWAPHHSIDDNKRRLSFSTFLKYSDLFLEIAERYKETIQFAFKPHPLLRAKLAESKVWGIEKTNFYYDQWATMNNGQLEEGSYEDLFLTSDALILDSASFMTEYMFTGKPSLYLVNDDNITDRFNEFGKKVYEVLYHARDEAEIYEFLENVVQQGSDPEKKQRNEFMANNLYQNGLMSASLNIKNELDRALSKNIS